MLLTSPGTMDAVPRLSRVLFPVLVPHVTSLCACRRLELLKLYREGRKPALVSKIVSDSVTLDYHVYPSFGRAVFMEFKVFILSELLCKSFCLAGRQCFSKYRQTK